MVVAANALRPTALVLFDPVGGGQSVDSVEPAKTALSTTCATTLTLFAEAHVPDATAGTPSCNKGRSWEAFALGSPGPRASAIVVDSTHCDGELPPRAACGFSCGGKAEETRQAIYKRHTTAFALAVLRDDAEAAVAMGEAFPADAGLRNVRVEDGVSCDGRGWPGRGASGGGGASTVDAVGGAGGAGDASNAGDSLPAADDGCSCRAAVAAPGGSLALLLGGLAFVVDRCRRARRVARPHP